MTDPKGMRRLHTISIGVSAAPALFLAVLLIGSGICFFAVGNDIWNETLFAVRNASDTGFLLYSNLHYAKDRLLIGIIAFCIGINVFFLTLYRIVQKQKK